MTNHWEKPGFEVLRVSGECTAYSGAEAVEDRRVVGVGTIAPSVRPARPRISKTQAEAKSPAVH